MVHGLTLVAHGSYATNILAHNDFLFCLFLSGDKDKEEEFDFAVFNDWDDPMDLTSFFAPDKIAEKTDQLKSALQRSSKK